MSHRTKAPPSVVGIVLAAGSARRMGRQKLLLPIDGAPLAQRAVDLATAELSRSVLVLGADADAVRSALRVSPTMTVVTNPRHGEGLATSLACALGAMPPDAAAALVLLADQPGVGAPAVRAVLAAAGEWPEPILRASYGGEPGHPVLIRRAAWPELRALTGDRGARAIARDRPEMVADVRLPGPVPSDVDTPEDYARATSGGA